METKSVLSGRSEGGEKVFYLFFHSFAHLVMWENFTICVISNLLLQASALNRFHDVFEVLTCHDWIPTLICARSQRVNICSPTNSLPLMIYTFFWIWCQVTWFWLWGFCSEYAGRQLLAAENCEHQVLKYLNERRKRIRTKNRARVYVCVWKLFVKLYTELCFNSLILLLGEFKFFSNWIYHT